MVKGKVGAVRVALVVAGLGIVGAGHASPVVLEGVPAYDWYHGCGPTAAASILGYWDLKGYSNLFDASGADVYLTAKVQDQISSPEHNAKYDPNPDDPTLDVPPMTSVADWFRTSVDQPYGWSWLSDSPAAFSGYASYRGYTIDSWYESVVSGQFTWTDLVAEVNAGRPVMFLVDTDGNGGTDHFIPVFGYEDRGANGLWYACNTTWHEAETVDWFQFRPMTSGNAWGVGYVTLAVPEAVPEPATLIALGAGVAMLLRRRRNR
jgi:hypothetical protein